MANMEHVFLLRKGVEVWNAWRERSGDKPDLSGAEFIRGELNEANLSRTNLVGTDLSGASLTWANLNGSDLRRANLGWADVAWSDLAEANLNGSKLIRANLNGVDLGGADLSRANLAEANLAEANLRNTIFARADLSGANLTNAILHKARFSKAKLAGANLSGANLTGADLSEAELSRVNLTASNLSEVNLAGAFLSSTIFTVVDLRDVTGLQTCRHGGPSALDHHTLARSWPLPLEFLRGCGLPDSFIHYLPSLLLDQPIQFYSCFISYSSKDQEFADRLHADLQNKGVRCWFAPHDLPWGAKTWDTIDEAIRLRDKVLLLLSEASIASDWVEDEVSKAFAEERGRKGLVLFPVRLDDAVMETAEPWAVKLRDQRNIGDFRGWKDHDTYRRSLEKLLKWLKVE